MKHGRSSELSGIQPRWDEIQYRTPEEKKAAFEKLADAGRKQEARKRLDRI